jgi:hypothetical protein
VYCLDFELRPFNNARASTALRDRDFFLRLRAYLSQ